MCRAIRAYYETTNLKKGIKVAGGVKSVQDALMYLSVAKEILEDDFMSVDYFRIGSSSLDKALREELSI